MTYFPRLLCFKKNVIKIWFMYDLYNVTILCPVPGCGDTLTSPSGTITSPGHPTNYPHGANCTWYISVLPGNLIRLLFDSFNLEYHTNSLRAK
uniref:CUB domain-containing protein n=1 Tax=Poecilia latipinna TaxID=48699 RepID=A0A3B3VA22_9TELE